MTPTLAEAVLWAHAISSGGMFGVIWFVQVVHYPLFARVGADAFAAYESTHQSRTSIIVAPLMLAQAACALSVWVIPGTAAWWAPTATLLTAATWALTFLVSVPLHARLSGGFDARAVRLLVLTNWPRTAAWTAHFVVSLWMLAEGVAGREGAA